VVEIAIKIKLILIRALRVYFKAKFGSLAKTQQMLHLLADHGV
jgi:hypothetical protein